MESNENLLVVVFRRRLPESSRGEAIVGVVMETVQRTNPTARIVSISRETDAKDSLILFFVGADPSEHADLRRAIRKAPMDWTGARTCQFSTAEELHDRLKMEFKPFQTEDQTEEQTRASSHAHVDFLRQLGLPEWFLDLYPKDPVPRVLIGEA